MTGAATQGHNRKLELRPLSYALGAEVVGLDLTGAMDAATLDAIRAAWNQHHVLLFRGQELDPDSLLTFAKRFGALDRHDATPHYRLESHPEILQITNRRIGGKPSETRNVGRNWHSDYSYTDHPAAGAALYCAEKPDVGGDTMFCNMVRAYDLLSDRMKTIVDGLDSVYDVSLVAGIGERTPEKVAELKRINPPIAHPAVRVHPDSGLRALYVSERVSHFHGMTPEESRPLIDFLCGFATRPDNVYRHQWRRNDLVMWDNRTTMHVALADFDPNQTRHMLRATLLGEPSGFVVGA